MRTLIVNTYAGSLLLGANKIKGSNIIGSYEDSGFGSWLTKRNQDRWTERIDNDGLPFFYDEYKAWPDQDLSDVIMLAHPPCAAFSNQNRSAAKRGVNTDAFACTRKVMKYGMTNNVAGMAIESVMGALTGAWETYETMAQQGGYHIYRILQNALLFGVPQFRERCWHVLIRKDIPKTDMTWTLAPKFIPIGATINHLLPGTQLDEPKRLNRYIKLLTDGPCVCGEHHGFEEARIREIALSHLEGHKRSGFGSRLAPFFPEISPMDICRRHVSKFSSGQPSILAEGGWAPVLLGTSFWIYKGEPIPEEAYKAIMGFPVDYQMPEEHNYGVRTMLSKGVCPPVATWILDNMRQHFGLPQGSPLTSDNGYVKICAPGRVVSFRPGKNTLLDKLEVMSKYGMPEDDELVELRDEEDMFVDEGETDGQQDSL